MTQYYSNAPYVSGVYDGHSNLVTSIGNVFSTLNIKNFSVTVVEVANNSLGINKNEKEKITIYPNPVKDILSFQTNSQIQKVSIFNSLGSIVFSTKELNSNFVNISNLESGVYFVEVQADKGSEIIKIIKE
jgi:hypothetical protein